jgi:hypothetical protein
MSNKQGINKKPVERPDIKSVWVESITEDGQRGVAKVESGAKGFKIRPGLEFTHYDTHLGEYVSYPWSRIIKIVYNYPKIKQVKLEVPKGRSNA